MDNIITGLKKVRYTMDNITVVGVSNMDKLVGCANVIDTVIQVMEAEKSGKPAEEVPVSEEAKKGE